MKAISKFETVITYKVSSADISLNAFIGRRFILIPFKILFPFMEKKIVKKSKHYHKSNRGTLKHWF